MAAYACVVAINTTATIVSALASYNAIACPICTTTSAIAEVNAVAVTSTSTFASAPGMLVIQLLIVDSHITVVIATACIEQFRLKREAGPRACQGNRHLSSSSTLGV